MYILLSCQQKIQQMLPKNLAESSLVGGRPFLCKLIIRNTVVFITMSKIDCFRCTIVSPSSKVRYRAKRPFCPCNDQRNYYSLLHKSFISWNTLTIDYYNPWKTHNYCNVWIYDEFKCWHFVLLWFSEPIKSHLFVIYFPYVLAVFNIEISAISSFINNKVHNLPLTTYR